MTGWILILAGAAAVYAVILLQRRSRRNSVAKRDGCSSDAIIASCDAPADIDLADMRRALDTVAATLHVPVGKLRASDRLENFAPGKWSVQFFGSDLDELDFLLRQARDSGISGPPVVTVREAVIVLARENAMTRAKQSEEGGQH
jgi:hypothetical protein